MKTKKIIEALSKEKGLCTFTLRKGGMCCTTGALLFHAGVPNIALTNAEKNNIATPQEFTYGGKSGVGILKEAYDLNLREITRLMDINDWLNGDVNGVAYTPRQRRDIVISILASGMDIMDVDPAFSVFDSPIAVEL